MAVEAPPADNLAALLGRAVPENVYGKLASTYVPSELGRVIPAAENYVAHMQFSSKGTKFFLILTDTKIYKGLLLLLLLLGVVLRDNTKLTKTGATNEQRPTH